ncbi:MAG TPA: Fe-S cluster assembly protein SufD [Pyrinomonadaceae bacterium]|jgi:Fe-S cluster assembly protein SufD
MVSPAATEKSGYAEAFRGLRERLRAGGGPAWLEQLRERAFGSFERSGFPSINNEEWKYTNVAPIAKAQFEPSPEGQAGAGALDASELRPFAYAEAGQSRLVFVNGFYRAELSAVEALPPGVVAADLNEALRDDGHAALMRAHLERRAGDDGNAFTALNTAFFAGGAFLLIPRGVKVEAPVHLLFLADNRQAGGVLSSPRVLVVAERDSAATLIESYESLGDGPYLTNTVVELVLAEGAELEHYKVQRESLEAFHVATTNAGLGRNSRYNSTAITLGAGLSRHDINVVLDQEGAECWVDGLYLVGTGQHTDTHSVIDHRRPHCTSHQLYKGILDGKSRAVFNGKIFVREGAQQTDARQANRNLLLSNEARVDTKPQLEIFADDVKCAHGATVGQLEEEELFYLSSRGLHPDIARNLLTYGFAEEVIDKIKLESIKAQLDEAVLNRLQARLEA